MTIPKMPVTVSMQDARVDWNEGKPDIRDSYRDQTGIVIANGPSLEDVPLEFLKRYPSIGTNNVYLWGMSDKEVKRYPKTRLKFCPSFYTVVGIDQLNTKDAISYVEPVIKEAKLAFVNRLAYQQVPYDNVYAVHSISLKTGQRAFNKRGFGFDILDRIGLGFTNTYVMLQIMYYLGFVKVFVVGLDNDYSKNADKLHFYPNDPRFACEPFMGRRQHEIGSNYVLGLANEAFIENGRKIININEFNNTPFEGKVGHGLEG